MFKKKKEFLIKKIDELIDILEKSNIEHIAFILGSRKEIIWRNTLAGIFRGIGIGIGVTIVSGIIIYFLQKLVKLNLPIIGKYINDLVDIIQTIKK